MANRAEGGAPVALGPGSPVVPLATGVALFAVYLLTYSGQFHSIDENAVFAVTRNLVEHGRVDIGALFWGPPYLEQGLVGPDGELYSKYGVGHSLLLAPLVWLGLHLPGVGVVQTAVLLDGIATAATGSLLGILARRLGFPRAGPWLAALYGLGTFAWVYARTLFGEPLVALLFTAALVAAPWSASEGSGAGFRAAWRWLLAGTFLGLTILIRPVNVLFAPLYAFLLPMPIWPGGSKTPGAPGVQGISVGAGPRPTSTGLFAARSSAALGAGVLAGIAAALWYNWVRFGDVFTFGYTEGFGQPLLVGLGAFLFSLDRSVLLYAPPLLALPATLGGVWQRERRVTFLCLGLGLATILIYARWDAFWGGPVWGPRYLLPALPLLLLLLAPGAEAAARGSRRWQVGLGLAGVAGALINAGGVLFDRYAALQEFGQRYPLILGPPRLVESDWAWVQPGSRGLDIAWLPIAFAVLLLSLAFIAVRLARTNDTPGSPAGFARPYRGQYPGTGTWLGFVALAFLVSLFCLREAARIGFGFPSRPGYQEAAHAVASQGQTGDVLVLNLAPFQDWGGALLWFANYYKAPVATAALFRAPPPDEVAVRRLDALARRHERIWLLTQDVAPGDPSSTAEAWLSRHTFPLDDRWLTNLRLSRFVARPAPLPAAGPFVLEGGISLHRALAPTHVSDGEAVAVELEWQPDAPIAEDLHVFVQLLAPDGTLAASRDSRPQNGYAPTSAWIAGQRVVDRHALLPPAPGIYQLIAGLYDSANGTRLATGAGADFVDLGQVRVGQ